MISNLPIFQAIKRLVVPTSTQIPEDLPEFDDIYDVRDQRPWEVEVSNYDRVRIEHAISTNHPVAITPNLSDAQLLKLHVCNSDKLTCQLVYHDMFDLYEVKSECQTQTVFSYQCGIYTPISEIY